MESFLDPQNSIFDDSSLHEFHEKDVEMNQSNKGMSAAKSG